MVDVYHEFEWPFEMMQHIVRALKPGGRVAFVEFKLEDPSIPIKTVHKMSEAQVLREMQPFGLTHLETVRTLPWQHLMIFQKPVDTTKPSPDKEGPPRRTAGAASPLGKGGRDPGRSAGADPATVRRAPSLSG